MLKPEGTTVTEELGALGGSLPRREPGQTLPPRLQNAKRARAEPEETQMALVLLFPHLTTTGGRPEVSAFSGVLSGSAGVRSSPRLRA